jgi:hypothetical protein
MLALKIDSVNPHRWHKQLQAARAGYQRFCTGLSTWFWQTLLRHAEALTIRPL